MTEPDGDLDVGRIRADFPALGSGWAHFDAPGGTQTPRPVIDAIAGTLAAPLANRGAGSPAARNAERAVAEFRSSVADLLGADPRGVVFGRSATELTMSLARTISLTWAPGDEVIVTRLDHDANIRPWLIAADRVGARVRWVDFDPATGQLANEAVEHVIGDRTRLVAVTGASNLIGTRPDIAAIAGLAKAADARLWVDGVHLASHALVDVPALGADFFVCSPYKFFGPHHGVLAADPEVLEELRPDKLLPSTDDVPERFELGTLPYEQLAGTTAAIDYIAGLVECVGDRRSRLIRSIGAAERHQARLGGMLRRGLAERGAMLYGADAPARTSTLLFDVPGRAAADVERHLASRQIAAPAGSFYALEAARHLGLGTSGAVRVGLAAYNTDDDVRRLLAALDELAGAR